MEGPILLNIQAFADTEGFKFTNDEVLMLGASLVDDDLGICFERGDLAVWYDEKHIVWSTAKAHGVESIERKCDMVWLKTMNLDEDDFNVLPQLKNLIELN